MAFKALKADVGRLRWASRLLRGPNNRLQANFNQNTRKKTRYRTRTQRQSAGPRAIQTQKKDLATHVARKGGQWSNRVEQAAGAYNRDGARRVARM